MREVHSFCLGSGISGPVAGRSRQKRQRGAAWRRQGQEGRRDRRRPGRTQRGVLPRPARAPRHRIRGARGSWAACCATHCRNTACQRPCSGRNSTSSKASAWNFRLQPEARRRRLARRPSRSRTTPFSSRPGTWKAMTAGVLGEESPNVWHALHFLEQVARGEPTNIGKKVVVIGGGNAAVDSGAHGAQAGLRRDHRLSPRAAGHAGDCRGSDRRRGEGVKLGSSSPAARRHRRARGASPASN